MDYLQYEIKNICNEMVSDVLNLIINGLPSILTSFGVEKTVDIVLNLIINGLPSILTFYKLLSFFISFSFKPYYKWITFNTGGGGSASVSMTSGF